MYSWLAPEVISLSVKLLDAVKDIVSPSLSISYPKRLLAFTLSISKVNFKFVSLNFAVALYSKFS